MPTRTWIYSVVFLLIGFAAPVRADLVISIGNASVTQGSTGTVDVFLASTASSLSPDQIDNYSFQLQITNNGADNTQLAFSTTQDFSYVSTNSSYVFSGDSEVAQSTPYFVGSPLTALYPNDSFSGADSTASGNPVSLSSGTTYLLASLTITTATGAAPIAGDSFTISLLQPSGTGSMFGTPTPTTVFDNIDFNNTGNELSATPYTSTSGTVNIMGVAAVPEPASIVSGLTALVICAGMLGVRRIRRD